MLKIVIGLVALGIVVLIHELGHFISARLSGVTVETFSIGWGPIIVRKKIGDTEYRLSALPLGGYCGMKGEKAVSESLEKGLIDIPKEPGSFYAAHPLKRVFIAFSGPAANLLLAFIALSFISAAGSLYHTYSNKIIPVSFSDVDSPSPAQEAGLIRGDEIVSLDGNDMHTFTDLQQYISLNPEKKIEAVYKRGESLLTTFVTPALDKKTGAGRIGVQPWIPLSIGSVESGSAAESAGLRAGDIVTAVDGRSVEDYFGFEEMFKEKPEEATLTIQRDSLILEKTIVVLYLQDSIPKTGIQWNTVIVTVPGTGFLDSISSGAEQTVRLIALTVKSIGLLFRGVDVSEAVSGPVRITLMIGEIAQSSISGFAELMSIICVSLFLMNLLPVPILDGGIILFSVLELFRGRPIRPKTMYYVQFIGIAFILFLFTLAMFGDIQFLLRQ